jgi:aerobic-type carbon monoxide dehydrogenase small subunit (CoxS/CutS family)
VTSPGKTITTTVKETLDSSSSENFIGITINGKAYEFQVESHTTLWALLRCELGILSVKDMCDGFGACGSCTVIMNGRPVLSCMILAIECDGAVIETVENMIEDNHPLIDTYVANDCMQCGYCTPGFIITSKALLDRNFSPTEADIREALGGNICRCGTYPQHITAVLEAAKEIQEVG